MLLNYLTIAFPNLLKYKVFSVINWNPQSGGGNGQANRYDAFEAISLVGSDWICCCIAPCTVDVEQVAREVCLPGWL